MEKMIDILFPNHFTCELCGDEIFDDNFLCQNCKDNLPIISGDICERCGEPLLSQATFCERCKNRASDITKVRSCFIYTDKIASAIKKLKFENYRYLVSFFANELKNLYIKENFEADLICYVPMHEKKQKERGFNQAKLLADALGEMLNIKVCDCLIKTKETKMQVDLDYKQRQDNLNGVFKIVNKQELNNKKVLLIDDIYTTGATLNECACVIKKAKPNKICALTIAHTCLNL